MILSRARISILGALLITFTACVKADKQKALDPEAEVRGYSLVQDLTTVNDRALFDSGQIVLEDISFSHSGSNQSFKLVNRIQLYMRLCGLKDRATRGIIRSTTFNISSELGNVLIARDSQDPHKVDSGDCLRWSQNVPNFNYLAPSHNIILHYEIDSMAAGLGKIIRRVGFNPWDMYRNQSKNSGFMDLTNFDHGEWPAGQWIFGQDRVLSALKGELGGATGFRLEMSGVTVEPSEKDKVQIAEYQTRIQQMTEAERQRLLEYEAQHLRETGIKFRVNFQGTPFIRLSNATDVPHDEVLKTGRFKVFMTLLASGASNDEKRYVLAEDLGSANPMNVSNLEWDVTPQGLLASIPMVLRSNSTYGRVKLAVKVEPIGLKGIEPFMAVYDMGLYDSWVRRQSPQIDAENYVPLNQVDYDKYIQSAEPVESNVATIRQAELFYFEPLVMRFVRIMPGESATDRTLQYSVTTCVNHGLYGNRVGPGLQFDIVTEDKGRPHKIRRQTNENGCLVWFGFLSHKYYHKEVLDKKSAKVRFVGTRALESDTYRETNEWESFVNKYEKEFVYYMNPWDEKWTFGWDERDMPKGYPAEIDEQKQNAPDSKLFIADFKYETMGFRYEIDKYMNLKVKKAVLLKVYPYVLKYNSIVLGRNGTEKLRDGVYLMKVALQKDYLDPAAKGVRIYDTKNPTSFLYKDTPLESPSASYPMAEFEDKPIGMGKSAREEAQFVSPRELGEGRKEYISIQTKLVRVLGGMIITPVEFEVSDLRLMRIRNQFFIQLQTIDEHKLRLATIIDQSVQGLQTEADVLQKYEQIFSALDTIEDIEDERIQMQMDQLNNAYVHFDTIADIEQRLRVSQEDAEKQIYEALGFGDMDFNSPEFQAKKQYIADKLAEINRYRALGFKASDRYSNAAQTFFRNEKRQIINRMIERFGSEAENVMKQDWVSTRDQEYIDSVKEDPMMRYFYLGASPDYNMTLQRILDYRLENAGDGIEGAELATLRSADFTESPLAPNFDLDLLLNDGTEEHQSGLPARTFVGPLTFVHNTNGSSLRPTDILEETFCPTATCTESEMFNQGVPSPTQPRPENSDVDPLPEIRFPRVTGLDVDGHITDDPIYNDGDSKNYENETNKYYGSLKAYSYKTFEDNPDHEQTGLINDKKMADERYVRRMEEGSQVINFVKTMGLKHVLLNENRETNYRSRLKNIDHDCAQTKPLSQLNSCFTDAAGSPHSMTATSLFEMINERKGPYPYHKGASFVSDPNEMAYWSQGQSSASGLFSSVQREYGQEGEEITMKDMQRLLKWGWKKRMSSLTRTERELEQAKPEDEQLWPLEDGKSRLFFHRMCFALSQKFFARGYFQKEVGFGFNKPIAGKNEYNLRVIHELEEYCHKFTDNLFDSPDATSDGINSKIYPPVIFERKARVFDTTGRYVYRGGKSLNINLSASFSLNHNEGFNSMNSISFKPWDIVEDVAGALGKVVKSIVGAVGFSASWSKSEGMTRSDGTTVSSGTFLVNQQASFVIELGQYERCMVVRFGPRLIKNFFERSQWLKDGFDDYEDVDTQGFMVCEGIVRKDPLPVNEKYYYFTQHFTEGDMLDTADLHNHPWLLQMRGYRDFQTFVSMIGARKVDYIDEDLLKMTLQNVTSDLQAMNSSNSNEGLQMELVNKQENMNWPLEELGKTYFNVLPTFPGLYTFIEDEPKADWPYDNTDPGVAMEDSGNE